MNNTHVKQQIPMNNTTMQANTHEQYTC